MMSSAASVVSSRLLRRAFSRVSRAISACSNDHTVERLRTFGVHLGTAFQLVDDLMGIWGDPDRTGKPGMSDLRARKKSLSLVAAMSNTALPAARQLLELYANAEPLSDHDLETAASLIDQAGGRQWSITEADRHIDAALAGSRPPGSTRHPSATSRRSPT